MVLLLRDQVSDQCESLQGGRVNNLICRRHIDHNVADDVDEKRLRLFAEFDAGKVEQPLQVPLDVDLG